MFGTPIEGHSQRKYSDIDQDVSTNLIKMLTAFVKFKWVSLTKSVENVLKYTNKQKAKHKVDIIRQTNVCLWENRVESLFFLTNKQKLVPVGL